ncbi:MAG TPA: bi-domain-containing oxidoreductase [Blastocatellia bacterium]|nr:bi-domain-containing oxidoreductase [Blastocatellia bacterium]
MKQVVQNFRTGELKVEELPPPSLRPRGVLVRTAYSLISPGTERTIVETAQSSLIGKARERPDLVRQVIDTFKREGLRSTYEKVRSRLDQIKPLGYSTSGSVVAVGEGAAEFKVGDLVACAGAGYASHAEVNFIPKNLCCKIPEGASLAAAAFTTVGSIALHSVRQAGARLGETVAVIGLGLVGQLTVQLLKAAGCDVLGIDIDGWACELARRSGADFVASDYDRARKQCEAMTAGRGADSIIITAGTKSDDPIELAAEIARDRGTVVVVGLVGMNVPRHAFYGKELELKLSRSYGPGRYDPEYEEKGIDYPIGYVRWTERRNMEAFLRLVADGSVNTEILATHRFSVAAADSAYELILGRSGEHCCGVVLEYPAPANISPDVLTTVHKRASVAGAAAVGFVGAGNFARGVLLPLVRREPNVQLLCVATATGISAKNTADQFGFACATTDWKRVVDDEQINCVFIATRHDLHASLAAEALARGKSVFVEKPLATNKAELRKVVEAAGRSGGVLMVGYNRRFAPLAGEVKKRLADLAGPMTIVYRINAGQLPAEHWSHDEIEGGGRIIGEVCHFIDFAQYLTDSLPVRVSGEAVPQSAAAGFIDDSVSISIGMADGSIVSIIYAASGDAAVAKERVEVFRGRSVAIIDDFKSAEFVRDGRRKRLGGGTQDKGHAAEIRAFFEAARKGTAAIPLASLVATSLTAIAAVEAIRSGATQTVDVGFPAGG